MKIAYSLWRHGLLSKIAMPFSEEDVLLGPGSSHALIFLFGRCTETDFLQLSIQLLQKTFLDVSNLSPLDLKNALCEFFKAAKAMDLIQK